jgi:hypothetical protein
MTKQGAVLGFTLAAACGLLAAPSLAQAPAANPPSPTANGPTVPAAKPGVYAASRINATRFRLVVTGHNFTQRDAIEKYLAYRAAELALEHKAPWFTLVENRNDGDPVPASKPDSSGMHYSFRMAYWRPVWRYKLAGASAWSTWSPFSGAPFFADGKDAKTVTDFEASAEIMLRKGPMEDSNPLAFEPRAVSEFLVNQVLRPE